MNEEKIIKIVRKEIIESIILKIILIITCLVTIMLNFKEYRQVFNNDFVIKNYSNLNSAITNKYKYVSLNVTNAKPTRFSFQNNNKIEKAIVYEIDYGDYSLILVLDKNTALTGNVDGEIIKENNNIRTIKSKLKEDNNKKYIKSYFSNMDYKKEKEVSKQKFYVTTIIILCLIFLLLIDIIKLFNPTKLHSYKKYIKKLYKV